jgi:hypothetical protein
MVIKGFKRSTFRDILSYQTILIFIKSSLPGRIRIAKEYIIAQIFSNGLVVCKLLSIVNSKCLDPMKMFAMEPFNSYLDTISTFILDLEHKLVFSFHFSERQNSTFVVFPYNRIPLKMTNLGLVIGGFRPFVNKHPIGYYPPGIIKVSSFSSGSMFLAKVHEKFTTLLPPNESNLLIFIVHKVESLQGKIGLFNN